MKIEVNFSSRISPYDYLARNETDVVNGREEHIGPLD